MRARYAELVWVVATACAQAHEPCPAPASPCAERAADEWALAPDGVRIVPEGIELWSGVDMAEATFLVVPDDGMPERLTFHLGLRDETVALLGIEPVGREWAQDRIDALGSTGEIERLLVCAPVPGGGELRLLPSRGSADPPPEGEFFGTPIRDAIILRRSGAPEARFPIWVPETDDLTRTACSQALVVRPSTGEHLRRCSYSFGGFDCIPSCFSGSFVCSDDRDALGGLDVCLP